jgi:hypothetical protein
VDQDTGLEEYQIWARYRDIGSCPIGDKTDLDLSQGYQVDWQEDAPVLEVFRSDMTQVSPDGVDVIGELPLFQIIELEYKVQNPSVTSELEITGITFESGENLVSVESLASLPLLIGPGEELPLVVQFEVVSPGEFDFDLNLVHTASNGSPFSFTIQGEGEEPANPIQSITAQPASPGQALIGDDYLLETTIAIDAPTTGALKVSLLDSSEESVLEPYCQDISSSGPDLVIQDWTWSESSAALQTYEIHTEFFAREDCPPSNQPLGTQVVNYEVNWQEELPELEIRNTEDVLIPAEGNVNLGQYEYYQTVNLSYLIRNISSTSSLNITSIGIENLMNISNVDVVPESGLVLGQSADESLEISFLVGNTGGFSFELVVEHQGSNPSPYRITFQGEGIMSDNPIQYVVPNPTSPGSSLIGTPFDMAVEIGLAAPDSGALQISLVDKVSGKILDENCQLLVDQLDQPRNIGLVVNQNNPGSKEYELVTKYRVQGSCPITAEQDNDLKQTYIINWEEEVPALVIKEQDGTMIPAGGIDIIGDQAFYQEVILSYIIRNTSSTTGLSMDKLQVANLMHVESVQIEPSGPVVVPPNGELPINVRFLVSEIKNFSLDVAVNHDSSNASPYSFSIMGTGVMNDNPFREMSVTPSSPAELFIPEEMSVNVHIEIDPAAPGVVEVSLKRMGYSEGMGQTCFPILGEHSFLDVDLNWGENLPGAVDYEIDVVYQALGSCPLEGSADAAISEAYQVTWKTHLPELTVNRPEGVTIFDGAVDYIGNHDFFRFVEVTYVIDNHNNAGPLIIDGIEPENLVNLREVLIEPAGVIEIPPGGSQEIKITFQVLTLEPYSFDLIWNHNGSNSTPYITGIMGDSSLDLGDTPVDSWLYRFVESLIKSGFFLKLPILGFFLVRKKKRSS